MATMKIKKGDTVKVIAGADKGLSLIHISGAGGIWGRCMTWSGQVGYWCMS